MRLMEFTEEERGRSACIPVHLSSSSSREQSSVSFLSSCPEMISFSLNSQHWFSAFLHSFLGGISFPFFFSCFCIVHTSLCIYWPLGYSTYLHASIYCTCLIPRNFQTSKLLWYNVREAATWIWYYGVLPWIPSVSFFAIIHIAGNSLLPVEPCNDDIPYTPQCNMYAEEIPVLMLLM